MTLKPQERRSEIAARIEREGEMSVETLAEAFGVSLETIRRDLALLSELGRVRKIHGGAKRAQLHTEPSFAERMTEDTAEKQIIGQKLQRELRAGDKIFMDTGSTTLIACEALLDMQDITVITNSILVAQKLGANPHLSIYLLGGIYGPGNQQTVGSMVIEQIGHFHADHAVMTLSGLDSVSGVTFSDHAEAEIARAMMARSESTTFLAHAAKFGRRAAFRTCGLDDIDTLITMDSPPEPLASDLARAGVRIPD